MKAPGIRNEVGQQVPQRARSGVTPVVERRSKVVPGVRLMKFTLLRRGRRAAELKGNERHSRRQGQLATVENIQAVEVLGGDRLVGADVEDVDAIGAYPTDARSFAR